MNTNGTTNANSITERAMLVSLNVQQWMGAKHDKKISDEVAVTYKSDASMGHYRKLLVAKSSLERLRKITSAARHEHYNRTLPWTDGGVRILSSVGYFEYAEKMREYEREWALAVSEFITAYPQLIDEARKRLNGLFNGKDYPDVSRMNKKFSFGFNVLPMPTAEDFRVELGDAETTRVRAEIEQSINATLEAAMKDVWERVHEVVARMIERLRAFSVTEEGTKHAFRDSLVDNIRELLNMLPALNITEDQNLTQFAKRIDAELLAHTPEQLRESDTVRERTANAAEAILKEMENFI